MVLHRAGVTNSLSPTFEIDRNTASALAHVVVFDSDSLVARADEPATIAIIEIPADAGQVNLELDPTATLLSNASGTQSATSANGLLRLGAATVAGEGEPRRRPAAEEKQP
jgi:hypothetical protein